MPDPFSPFWLAQINRHTPDTVGLNLEAMSLDEYIEGRDETLIIANEGADPALIEVQRLPWKLIAKLDSLSGNARFMFAFAAACHRVKIGAEILTAKVTRDKVNGVLLAPESWLAQIADHPRFGPYAIFEAGQAACDFAMLRPEQRRLFSSPVG